jgi:hypothetical protein
MKNIINNLMIVLFSLVVLGATSAYADNTIESISAYNNQKTITFEINGRFSDGNESHVRFFIDADNDPSTGYSDWLIEGVDYRVKDNRFYEFNDGDWVRINNIITTYKQDDYISSEVPLPLLNNSSTINFTAVVMDSDWDNWQIYGEMVSYDFEGSNNDGEVVDEETESVSYSDSVLNAKLQYQEVDKSPKFIGFIGKFGEDNNNGNYYLSENGYLTFEVSEWQDVKSKRIELRDVNEWGVDGSTRKRMVGEVKFSKPEGDIDEITWMQMHHKHTGAKPFVRLVWKNNKDGHYDSLWAVIRDNDKPNNAKWFYLGERPNSFFTTMIAIENEKLTIEVANSQHTQDVPFYWKDQRNYFKAGLYFSGKSKSKTRDASVQFEVLNITN